MALLRVRHLDRVIYKPQEESSGVSAIVEAAMTDTRTADVLELQPFEYKQKCGRWSHVKKLMPEASIH